MDADVSLSQVAGDRMAAMLPALLAELRARRRRRQTRRAAAALLAAVTVAWLLGPRAFGGADAVPTKLPSVAGWAIVPTDDGVLARCRVATRADARWWLSDEALRAELRRGDRPDGLVRVAGVVSVCTEAVDPWPATALE